MNPSQVEARSAGRAPTRSGSSAPTSSAPSPRMRGSGSNSWPAITRWGPSGPAPTGRSSWRAGRSDGLDPARVAGGVPERTAARVTVFPMPGSDPVRLLLVEDVPQVAQYVRGLLNAQSQVRLVDVIADGSSALRHIVE